MTIDLEHSYLLKPGLWEMTGSYVDRNNNSWPQRGQLVITHEPDIWVIEAQLVINTGETQTVNSRYDVQPLAPGAAFTEWKSETGGPEPVLGLFVVVDDTLMSPWHSRSGAYWGQEILIRQSQTEYQGRGFAFLNQEKVSAWSTRLTRNSGQ